MEHGRRPALEHARKRIMRPSKPSSLKPAHFRRCAVAPWTADCAAIGSRLGVFLGVKGCCPEPRWYHAAKTVTYRPFQEPGSTCAHLGSRCTLTTYVSIRDGGRHHPLRLVQ